MEPDDDDAHGRAHEHGHHEGGEGGEGGGDDEGDGAAGMRLGSPDGPDEPRHGVDGPYDDDDDDDEAYARDERT